MNVEDHLHCATRQAGETTVLAVRGEIDIESAPTFREAVQRVMQQGITVHLDLSGVSFMDSSGLHVLLETAFRPTGHSNGIVLDKISAPVLRVLRATGLDTVLVPAADCQTVN